MDDAVSVRIAKQMTEHVKGLEAASGAIVERSYGEWEMDLKSPGNWGLQDANKLHIDVVAHTTEQAAELSSRTSLQFEVPVDIGVRQKLGIPEQDAASGLLNVEEIDRLVALTQAIHVGLTRQRLPDFDCAVWLSTRLMAAPITEHLRKLRQFTSIVRVTFRADVEIPVEG